MDMANLEIRVYQIKGFCPVYSQNTCFKIKDGFILESKKPIYLHSLLSIMPYYVALSKGVAPSKLGLMKKKKIGRKNKKIENEDKSLENKNEINSGYVQCLDPCEITGGGTVIFKITTVKE